MDTLPQPVDPVVLVAADQATAPTVEAPTASIEGPHIKDHASEFTGERHPTENLPIEGLSKEESPTQSRPIEDIATRDLPAEVLHTDGLTTGDHPIEKHPTEDHVSEAAPTEKQPTGGNASNVSSTVQNFTLQDHINLVITRLMKGGREDEDICRDLDWLTLVFTTSSAIPGAPGAPSAGSPITFPVALQIDKVMDMDCAETLLYHLGHLQSQDVRGCALRTTAAYLRGSKLGRDNLSTFFLDRARRGTCNDYITAFSVAAATFPLAPDVMSELILGGSFLKSLPSLMCEWSTGRTLETVCLEMLNAACMNLRCRQAVKKYCTDWLQEIVDRNLSIVPHSPNSDSLLLQSEKIQGLAAIILTKVNAEQSSQSSPPTPSDESEDLERITGQDLSSIFQRLLLENKEKTPELPIEGLMYSSILPQGKQSIASDTSTLKRLVEALAAAPPRSAVKFGTLTVFANLTRYLPDMSDEQRHMQQLKAYANAAKKPVGPDPLDRDGPVAARCKAVFRAGLVPALVAQSKFCSHASMAQILRILDALSVSSSLRGPMAQQGAVRLLINTWGALPHSDSQICGLAAQALARILITIDPTLVFMGSHGLSMHSAIRPLASIIRPDPTGDIRTLLPTFEALMALTNVASVDDDDARRSIIHIAWRDIEEQMLSTNIRVSRAAVELVCNLVQAPDGVALYTDQSQQSVDRLSVLVALADSDDERTRSAAGGALAALTAHEAVVSALLRRDRCIHVILSLCLDSSEDVRHRGVFVLRNLLTVDGPTGQKARQEILASDGAKMLRDGATKNGGGDLPAIIAEVLKILEEN